MEKMITRELKRPIWGSEHKETKMNELEVGTTYKNFTELSKALGCPTPPQGNSKKAVMNALNERYELSKDGRAITVIGKKDYIPKVKRSNNTKYAEILHEALYCYGILHKDYSIRGKQYRFTKTRSDWQSEFGMITFDWKKYISGREHSVIIGKLIRQGIGAGEIEPFEFEVNRKLHEVFMGFLNSEKYHKQATYEKKYVIVGKEIDPDTGMQRTSFERFATKEETKIINDIEAELLQSKKFNVATPFLLKADKRKEFYDLLTRKAIHIMQERSHSISWSYGSEWTFYQAVCISIKNLPSEKPPEDEMKRYREELPILREQIRKMVKNMLLENIPLYHKKLVAKAEKNKMGYLADGFCSRMEKYVKFFW